MYSRSTKTKEVDCLQYEMFQSKCGGPGQSLDSKKNIDLSVLPRYKFFGEIEQYFEKGVNLVVNFGKNDNWFSKYFSCQF